MQPDKTDKKILKELLSDARASLRDISKKANVSVVTVMNRVKRLEKAGIITGYTSTLDYEKLGYDLSVAIDISVAKGKLFQVEKKIATHPNVISVYDTTGQFDALVIARFKTRATLDKFLKKIQSYEFVEKTHTKLILNIMKEESITP